MHFLVGFTLIKCFRISCQLLNFHKYSINQLQSILLFIHLDSYHFVFSSFISFIFQLERKAEVEVVNAHWEIREWIKNYIMIVDHALVYSVVSKIHSGGSSLNDQWFR